MNRIKKIAEFLHDYLVGFYPFITCLIGGGAFHFAVSGDGGWRFVWGFLIATAIWCFAIDLAEVRAEAKAKIETVEFFIKSFNDTRK